MNRIPKAVVDLNVIPEGWSLDKFIEVVKKTDIIFVDTYHYKGNDLGVKIVNQKLKVKQIEDTMTKFKQYTFLFAVLVIAFILFATLLGTYFEALSVTGGLLVGYFYKQSIEDKIAEWTKKA